MLGACERLGGLPDLDLAALVPVMARAEECRLAELADPRYLTLGKHELLEPGRLLDGHGGPSRDCRPPPATPWP